MVHYLFKGTRASDSDDASLELLVNHRNEIYISIEKEGHLPSYVCLDIETAIKLSKELRKAISESKENQASL